MSKSKGWHKGRGKPGSTRRGKLNTRPDVPVTVFPRSNIFSVPPGVPRTSIETSQALARLQTRTGRQIGLHEALSGNRDMPEHIDVLGRIDQVFKNGPRSELTLVTLSGMLSQALGYDVDRYQITVRSEPRADAPMVRINWQREDPGR